MKISLAPCRVKAIHLGEVWLNYIHMGSSVVKAKYAIIDEEGGVCGYYEKNGDWSDEALEAMRKLADVLENEVLGVFFSLPKMGVPEVTSTVEPPQF